MFAIRNRTLYVPKYISFFILKLLYYLSHLFKSASFQWMFTINYQTHESYAIFNYDKSEWPSSSLDESSIVLIGYADAKSKYIFSFSNTKSDDIDPSQIFQTNGNISEYNDILLRHSTLFL
jgi:hypothetical protein